MPNQQEREGPSVRWRSCSDALAFAAPTDPAFAPVRDYRRYFALVAAPAPVWTEHALALADREIHPSVKSFLLREKRFGSSRSDWGHGSRAHSVMYSTHGIGMQDFFPIFVRAYLQVELPWRENPAILDPDETLRSLDAGVWP